MSSDTLISVEGVGKRYWLGHVEKGRGLRHALQEAVVGFGRREIKEVFWALREVSFEVRRGEVLGIVGRNGAGKSTLLKILSRITEPSEGRIRLRGRVGSLLEVGTGFHPELTGRENIFLNGAILGMRRAEILRKFDEIVAFAEVDQFLDTPVKRYSSGMHVRLGFAVAAHLEPEILIVDEVLAVGDAAFQKKCLGKMESVARGEGRTVLFVSHNMGAVAQLCSRGLLLDAGRVALDGKADEAVARYLGGGTASGGVWKSVEAKRTKKVFFRTVSLLNHLGQPSNELDVRFPFVVEVEYEIPKALRKIELSVRILTGDGRAVVTLLLSELSPEAVEAEKQGFYRSRVKFPGMFLMAGAYLLNVAAHEPMGEIFDLVEGAISFVIRDTGTVFSKYPNHSGIGVVMQSLPWEEERIV